MRRLCHPHPLVPALHWGRTGGARIGLGSSCRRDSELLFRTLVYERRFCASQGSASPSSFLPGASIAERDTFAHGARKGGSGDRSGLRPTGPADDFTERRMAAAGHTDNDAFGHHDPLEAATGALVAAKTTSTADVPTDAAAAAVASASHLDLAGEVDEVVSSRNRRRNRRKRTADTILGDVLHDALRLRDMGEKPTVDFVYKRTQERMYEEEYGRKPPSRKESATKFIPFPPDFHLHRLLPLYGERSGAEEPELPSSSSDAETERPTGTGVTYTKNFLHTYGLAPLDPWPVRAITPSNPVWTKRDVELDKEKTAGKALAAWEERMYAPRPGLDISGEFLDALDELAHWEVQLLRFLRDAPLSQRRSLPFLHEWYRLLVHRVIRAERRYVRIRDALASSMKISLSLFKRTEQPVEEVRSYYAEAHRSLASPNYDPQRMKKSALAPLMRMSDQEFAEWQEVQRIRRNALVANLS